MSDLTGQHAVVTGGSRGIGLATAQLLAGQGAEVSVIARSRGSAESVIAADVTTPEGVRGAFEQAVASRGPVTILVNNVGGAESAPFLRTDSGMLERMMNLNLMSTWLCTRAVLPAMLEAGAGRIVNVASEAGRSGYPYVSAYVTAKHAVVGLTRALAAEFDGKGIAVNAVCPGFVDTDMTAQAAAAVAGKAGKPVEDVLASYASANREGRLLTPQEVAERIAWFCAPAQVGVSGRVVDVTEVV